MKKTLIMATTANGFCTNPTNQNMSWTSEGDMSYFTKETKRIGTVIMGRKTYETLDKPLSDRKTIVVSSSLSPNVFQWGEITDLSLEAIFAWLKELGTEEVAICGGSHTNYSVLKEVGIDEIQITINPLMWGEGFKIFQPSVDLDLKLTHCERISDQVVLLKYDVLK